MEQKIKRLLPQVTNKIAAGEVIERPSSAVKELIENAIDAGSTNIEIYIVEGGKKRIQVIDNGCGITREDVPAALERFSTSKIESFEDLEKLATFGFRGEALASIASVSIVEMKTKAAGEDEGTLLRCEGSEIVSVRGIPWNRGTSISVDNVFFNTPARRKFQKNALSETRQIYRVFRHYALAYPGLSLSLYNDKRSIWNLKPADLKRRIADVFDPNISKNLIEVSQQNDVFSLYGYIGVPELTRSTRSDQYLFVNRRFIKNRTVEHGVYQGYGSTLSHGTGHPFYVLMLSLSPDLFDINIHPSKLEARFYDDRGLHHFISQTVRSSLGITELKLVETGRFPKRDNRKAQNILIARTDHEKERYRASTRAVTDLDSRTEGSSSEDGQPLIPVGDKTVFDRDKVWQVHQCYIF